MDTNAPETNPHSNMATNASEAISPSNLASNITTAERDPHSESRLIVGSFRFRSPPLPQLSWEEGLAEIENADWDDPDYFAAQRALMDQEAYRQEVLDEFGDLIFPVSPSPMARNTRPSMLSLSPTKSTGFNEYLSPVADTSSLKVASEEIASELELTHQKCARCRQEKALTEFISASSKDKTPGKTKECEACRADKRAKAKQAAQKRKAAKEAKASVERSTTPDYSPLSSAFPSNPFVTPNSESAQQMPQVGKKPKGMSNVVEKVMTRSQTRSASDASASDV